ncbi:3245_t:CDS:2 [Funneliformis geosporum]|uniref:3245_t:CDS:1 n=1 Tax=Funneliformis geosporum TaxID=1117311 RepID=A0A9W4SMF9_9GLOM|nr:3245_t:CDS:2 [Funneliformis geosporum]
MSDSSLGGRALTYCEMEKLVYPIHGHIVKLPESPKAFGYRGGRENGLAADGTNSEQVECKFYVIYLIKDLERGNGQSAAKRSGLTVSFGATRSLAAPTDYLPSGYLPRMEMYLDVATNDVRESAVSSTGF